MGHLINPISMRLGWFSNWVDIWYADNLYYSEYFYSILKVRLFIFYFFTMKEVEKFGYFYSHIKILNLCNSLVIHLFLYDGVRESLVADYFFDFTEAMREARMEMRIFTPLISFEPWGYLVLLNFIFNFQRKRWPSKKRTSFIHYLNLYRYDFIKFYFNKNFFLNNRFISSGVRLNFLFVYTIFLDLVNSIYLNAFRYDIKFEIIYKQLLVNIIAARYSRKFYSILSFYFCYIVNTFSKFENVYLYFYLLDNETVTARFISRFLARKLQQNHTVWEIINPIKKDLIKVRYDTRLNKGALLNRIFSLVTEKAKFISPFTFGTFRLAFTYLFISFKKWYYRNFLQLHSFFTHDFLILFREFYLFMSKRSFFFWSYLSSCKKIGLKFIYQYDLNKKFTANLVLKDSIVNPFLNQRIFFDVIHDLFFLNLDSFYFFDISLKINLTNFVYSNIFFNRYLRYTFWYYNFNKIASYNKKVYKNKIYRSSFNFIGFKFQCLGRFSRRQRAGKAQFRVSKMPLNTLNAVIDYGFFSVPLKNSSLGVKIWLYKKQEIDPYYQRIF